MNNKSHPSVNESYGAVSKQGIVMSMTTVYNTLEIPEEQCRGFDVLGMSISIYGLCPRGRSGQVTPKPRRKFKGTSP